MNNSNQNGANDRRDAKRMASSAVPKRPEPIISNPDPEVPAKATRRRFTAEYKRRILQEADSCEPGTGELGALLRREGLYASHLSNWRQQRDQGALDGLAPKKRGRKPAPVNPLADEIERLKRENERLRRNLKQAETIIEVQGKVSELLGINRTDESDETS